MTLFQTVTSDLAHPFSRTQRFCNPNERQP
jgi:hypothetical protein